MWRNHFRNSWRLPLQDGPLTERDIQSKCFPTKPVSASRLKIAATVPDSAIQPKKALAHANTSMETAEFGSQKINFQQSAVSRFERGELRVLIAESGWIFKAQRKDDTHACHALNLPHGTVSCFFFWLPHVPMNTQPSYSGVRRHWHARRQAALRRAH